MTYTMLSSAPFSTFTKALPLPFPPPILLPVFLRRPWIRRISHSPRSAVVDIYVPHAAHGVCHAHPIVIVAGIGTAVDVAVDRAVDVDVVDVVPPDHEAFRAIGISTIDQAVVDIVASIVIPTNLARPIIETVKTIANTGISIVEIVIPPDHISASTAGDVDETAVAARA